MVVVMAPEATESDIDAIVELINTAGGEAFVSRGVSRTIIGLVGDVEQFGALNLRSYPGVSDVVRRKADERDLLRGARDRYSFGGVPLAHLRVGLGPSDLSEHRGCRREEAVDREALRTLWGPNE